MDAEKKAKLEKELLRQKYILKATQAKILKIEGQLETGITRTCRNKPKTEQKMTKDDSKMTNNAPKQQVDDKAKDEKKGFFDSVFN